MHKDNGPADPAVRLRADQFRRYAGTHGLSSDQEIASRTGLARTTVFRLLNGDVAPGERIIAALLAAFPDRRFEDFFEIVSEAA